MKDKEGIIFGLAFATVLTSLFVFIVFSVPAMQSYEETGECFPRPNGFDCNDLCFGNNYTFSPKPSGYVDGNMCRCFTDDGKEIVWLEWRDLK